MSKSRNNNSQPEKQDRDAYEAPRLKQFGQVGALTQNGSNNGQEFFMMGQVVTMMMN